jgi:hypothetical protein
MSRPELSREEGLARLEEGAREILERITDEALERARSETARIFLGQLRERYEPALKATEWDGDQIQAFGAQSRQVAIAAAAGFEMGTGAWEKEIDVERMPFEDWQGCISRCVGRATACLDACGWLEDAETEALCWATCALYFDLCLVGCVPLF